MEVRLLGPIAIVAEGGVVPLRQRRQRALLALLALRAGETLAADRLVEELWGVEAPRTAVASLHNAVSQLRKLLGPDVLLTRDRGYVLDTKRVTVDVVTFEHLLGEARAARSMQDEETAGTILREALALWHGAALADLAYEPFAQAEIRRLEELRQNAIEERVDADLALGRHAELVPELESLVAHEPLRERLRGQLMLALYRAGRQADALEAYRSARETLIEELAIEPGPELRRLQAAILRQDESLLLGATRPRSPAGTMQFRRLATILVADAVASSPGEELDPETLHRVLGRYYDTVAEIVRAHGAAAQRMAGDAVMAAFGAVTGDERHALRAVRAALDVRLAVERLAVHLADDRGRLDVRIGIATGEVLASGTGGRQQLVTGEAIGVAAALQQAAEPGDVLVGPLTRRLLGTAATVAPFTDVAITGRARSVPAVRVLGVSDETAPAAASADGPLVGRKSELRALRAALRAARAESAVRAVTVVGEAGVGKSRLGREVVRGARGFDTLVVRCPSYGQGITYRPLRQLVGDDRGVIRAALGTDADADVVAERLATFEGTAAEIAWAFTRWCDARARNRPLLLVLDDVHWAEPTLLDLVEHLVDHGKGPLAVLLLSREELLEERPELLEGRVNATRLALEGLAVAETEGLVAQLLGGAPLPIDVRARIFEAAEGNPLFVEQFVALAAEGAVLAAEEAMPASIQALLAARLDRLGPGERAVLERASVVGREFTQAHVIALLDTAAGPATGRHLATLARRRFVESRGDGSFRFHHVLVQEAAYRSAPKSLRSELHERLADIFDREGGTPDAVIGYHLEQAYRLRAELAAPDRAALRLAEDAGRRLGSAGIRAWQREDVPATVNLLERATHLLPEEDRERLALLCELGTALKQTLDDERSERTLVETAAVSSRLGERGFTLRAELEMAWPRLVRGEMTTEDMAALADRAIGVFETHGDDRGLSRAWHVKAAVSLVRYRGAECADAANRALTHCELAGYSTSGCLSLLAGGLTLGPAPVDSAIARCSELTTRVSTMRVGRAYVMLFVALLEAMRGRVARGRRLLEEAWSIAADAGAPPTHDWTSVRASIETLAGDHARAESMLRDACERLEDGGEVAWLATFLSKLGEAVYAQGRYAEALELSARAEAVSPSDDLLAQTSWRQLRAKAWARAGALDEGQRLATDAVRLLEDTDALNERASALLDLAETLHLADEHDRAGAAVAKALELFAAKGNLQAARGARTRFAELAVAAAS